MVDASVLLYAVDEQDPLYDIARAWIDDALNDVERVGLPWASLMAF